MSSVYLGFVHSAIRSGRLLTAITLALTLQTTASFAYSAQQQELCTGDAMRLCSEYIPDVDRITTCMVEHYEALSDGCKSVFEAPPPPPAAATNKPVTYAPSSRKPSKPLNLAPNQGHS
jgi:hypothetical protein